MDFLSLPFHSLINIQGQLTAEERDVESRLAELLRAGQAYETPPAGAHMRLEELRFERNMIRFWLLDAQAVIKARKQQYFESRVLEAFTLLHPDLNQEFQAELEQNPFSLSGFGCPEMILQSIESCYRKIESAFQDQQSMLVQMSLNDGNPEIGEDWLSRVNHALMKSRTFFSRQCGKARSLRTQFSDAYRNNERHHQFNILRSRYGASLIDQLASASEGKWKKAA